MSAEVPRKPVLVLGVGNTLLRDEGVGVHVVRRLQTMELPQTVEVVEGGVMGLDLLDAMENRQKVIIVDAVEGGLRPGTIYRLTPEDMDMGEGKCLSSVHDINLPYVLNTAGLLGITIDPVIIGVEPKDMDVAYDELSPEIEMVVPDVISAVLKEIEGKLLVAGD